MSSSTCTHVLAIYVTHGSTKGYCIWLLMKNYLTIYHLKTRYLIIHMYIYVDLKQASCEMEKGAAWHKGWVKKNWRPRHGMNNYVDCNKCLYYLVHTLFSQLGYFWSRYSHCTNQTYVHTYVYILGKSFKEICKWSSYTCLTFML